MQIAHFSDEHITKAAELLAQRQQRDRNILPELPDRFESAQEAETAVRAALAREHAAGFAALDDDRLVAYLIGDRVIDDVWVRSGWIRWGGCAYDPSAGVELVRDLYAALGKHWVGYGIFTHCALVPVSDPAMIGAFFSLSFGVQQVHALQSIKEMSSGRRPVPAGIEMRPAGSGDEQHLVKLSDIIWREQVEAPVWAPMMPDEVAGREAAWAELATDDEVTAWLAMRGEEPLAVQMYWSSEADADNVMIPEDCVYLSVAGTRPEARGLGLGTWLSEHILAETYAAGFRYCETDWRSTNLLSSRFWPKRGYRPVFYRLVRRVDQRISWATGTPLE
jgi:GNAT superfamily N-acetyltransferase